MRNVKRSRADCCGSRTDRIPTPGLQRRTHPGTAMMRTAFGGERVVDTLVGDRTPHTSRGFTMTLAPPIVLTGRLLSPFVRRVAVTLAHLGIGFERKVLSAIDDVAEIERANPIGRVPVLVLPDGETLVDSAAILDHVDERVGPERALVPPAGAPRRRALYLLALSCGTIERAMVANAERRRPSELQMPDRLSRLLRQTGQGFEALDRELSDHEWFIEGRPMQPDITTAVGVTFVRHIFPDLMQGARIPRLEALTERCEALPAFRSMQID